MEAPAAIAAEAANAAATQDFCKRFLSFIGFESKVIRPKRCPQKWKKPSQNHSAAAGDRESRNKGPMRTENET